MKTVCSLAALLLVAAVVLAQGRAETPQESYEAFVRYVLNEDANGKPYAQADRISGLRGCFDFDAHFKLREKDLGRALTADERAGEEADLLASFQSKELADSLRGRKLRYLPSPEPDIEKAAAELHIALRLGDGSERAFRVLMNLDRASGRWRWYTSEPIQQAQPDAPGRIAEIERELEDLARERRKLDDRARDLRDELERLRRPLVAEGTPEKAVERAWQALQAGNHAAFVERHVNDRRKRADTPEARKRFDDLRAKLAKFAIVDARLDGDRATVRVQVYVKRGEAETRSTLAVRLLRERGEWRIDDDP